MLLPLSHIGVVFHSVYCLAILLFPSLVYILTFVLGSATSPVSDVVKMLTHVLMFSWSAVLPSSSESIKMFTLLVSSLVSSLSCPAFHSGILICFSVFMCLLARCCLSWPWLICKRDYCLNATTLVKQRINNNKRKPFSMGSRPSFLRVNQLC